MAGWLTVIADRRGIHGAGSGARDIESALAAMRKWMGDVRPLLAFAAEEYRSSTVKRFDTHTGPDGRAWKWLKPETIRKKRYGSKKSVGPPENQWVHTGAAKRAVKVRFQSNNVVQVGFMGREASYARHVHFGAPKANIPARPLLGFTKKSNEIVYAAMRRFMRGERL